MTDDDTDRQHPHKPLAQHGYSAVALNLLVLPQHSDEPAYLEPGQLPERWAAIVNDTYESARTHAVHEYSTPVLTYASNA